MCEWVNVKDRMPEPNELVLFWEHSDIETVPGHVCLGYKATAAPDGVWWDNSNCDYDGDPADVYAVTYWMPLPEGPEGNG